MPGIREKNQEIGNVYIECTVGGIWYHKDCFGISNEFLMFLKDQKNTRLAVYAPKVNYRLKEMEKSLDNDDVEDPKKNAVDIAKVEKKMEKIEEKLNNHSREEKLGN